MMEEEYNKLKEKYNLPNFKELDNEFEISTIDSEHFILRCIIDKIIDRIDYFSCILEHILQPESSSFKSIQESGFFDDLEKKEIYNLFKKLIILNRESSKISLNRDEKQEAEFIINSFNQWMEIKQDLLKNIEKLKNSWEKDTINNEKLGYLG